MFKVVNFSKSVLTAGAVILVLVIGACSSNDDSSSIDNQSQPTATVQTIKVTVGPTPTAVAVPTATPGSDRSADEQVIRDIWSSQVAVIANEQYGRLQETCHPGYAELENRTEAEIETQFKEFVSNFWNVLAPTLRFSEPEILIVGGIQAIVSVAVENTRGNVEPFGIFLTKHEDGNWYDDCAVGGWKSLRLKPSAVSK
jgi:hypothetical protein